MSKTQLVKVASRPDHFEEVNEMLSKKWVVVHCVAQHIAMVTTESYPHKIILEQGNIIFVLEKE